jgi:hypothetical protein
MPHVRRVLWALVRTRPGRRFLYAAIRNGAVRRSLWVPRRRRDLPLLLLEDGRIRTAAFAALESEPVRAAVVVELRRRGTARPFATQQVIQALTSTSQRAELRRTLDRPDVLRAVRTAANGGVVATIKVVWLAAGLKLRGLMR